ncbi:hypothetical protein K2F45_11450 [Sphingobacterium siyangense]|uniref:hypothetical protein n=1 Tax=Sphingobacterium siyangense TaxID=459529 RepID=UPI0019191286|nr:MULTISPECIES: hypothetical protein [Sphingobacterium]QQT32849.1 hypothetical protein I6I99_09915 [Sphingobacterium multivorum]UQA77551.1 hypothetical protein K2F45_11450 [Sphingobacterium siyangense]
MKRLNVIFFISLFGWVYSASAQTTQPKDSVLLAKIYLLDIQRSFSKKQERQQKIVMLKSLINKGKTLDKVFHRSQLSHLSRSFQFILHSLVLYTSDLKIAADSPMERQYLDKNIPLLLKQIDNFRASNQ